MNYDKVKDPSGSGGRVEALTIGLKEAILIMALVISSGGGSVLWLNSQLVQIRQYVQQNAYDRWTRSMMQELCRMLERDNQDFKCPQKLPTFDPPKDIFGALKY